MPLSIEGIFSEISIFSSKTHPAKQESDVTEDLLAKSRAPRGYRTRSSSSIQVHGDGQFRFSDSICNIKPLHVLLARHQTQTYYGESAHYGISYIHDSGYDYMDPNQITSTRTILGTNVLLSIQDLLLGQDYYSCRQLPKKGSSYGPKLRKLNLKTFSPSTGISSQYAEVNSN